MEELVYIDGYRAKVIINKASKSMRNLLGAVRMVYVGARYPWIKPGMTLVVPTGPSLLLAHHHTGLRTRGFLGFEVTRTVELVETVVTKHPVTGMDGSRVDQDPVTVQVADYQSEADNELGFSVGVSLLIFGTPVDKNFKVDGRRVSSSVERNGLFFVELED